MQSDEASMSVIREEIDFVNLDGILIYKKDKI